MTLRLIVTELNGRVQIAVDPDGPLVLAEGKTLPDTRMRAIGALTQLIRQMDQLGAADVRKATGRPRG